MCAEAILSFKLVSANCNFVWNKSDASVAAVDGLMEILVSMHLSG